MGKAGNGALDQRTNQPQANNKNPFKQADLGLHLVRDRSQGQLIHWHRKVLPTIHIYQDTSLITAILLTSVKSPLESKLPPASTPVHLNAKFHAPCCLDGWVGYRGKCYYFSEAEGTWDSSQSFCSSLNASLAWIDTEKDLMFILRYKGVSEFWIGLKRVSAQTWQWSLGFLPIADLADRWAAALPLQPSNGQLRWKCFKDSWYFLKSSVRI
uniref:C-type lectin domain-containing protein n=1 Tax=Terrapene triunguis TaxID=2587831 RepID=A0A674J129_9SAUR